MPQTPLLDIGPRPRQINAPRLPQVRGMASSTVAQSLGAGLAVPIQDNSNVIAQSGATIGQAVGHLGGVFHELAERERRANAIAEEADAMSRLDKVKADHAQWRLENPGKPHEWAADYKTRWDGAVKDLEGRKYQPEVALGLKTTIARRSELDVAEVRLDATRSIIERGVQTVEARRRLAVENGDWRGANEAVDEHGRLTGAPPEQTQLFKVMNGKAVLGKQTQQIQAQAEQLIAQGRASEAQKLVDDYVPPPGAEQDWSTAKTELTTDISFRAAVKQKNDTVEVWARTDPRKGLSELASLGLPKLDEERARDQLEAAQENNANVAAEEGRKKIDVLRAVGQLDTAKLEDIADTGKLGDWHKAYLSSLLEEAKDKTPEGQERRMEAEAERYLAVKAALMAYKPTGDKRQDDKARARFSLAIDSFQEGLQTNLRSLWEGANAGDPVISALGPSLERMTRAAMGASETPVIAESGNPVMKKGEKVGYYVNPGWLWDSKKEFTEPDKPVTNRDPAKAKIMTKALQAASRELEEMATPELIKLWENDPKKLRELERAIMLKYKIPIVKEAQTTPDSALIPEAKTLPAVQSQIDAALPLN